MGRSIPIKLLIISDGKPLEYSTLEKLLNSVFHPKWKEAELWVSESEVNSKHVLKYSQAYLYIYENKDLSEAQKECDSILGITNKENPKSFEHLKNLNKPYKILEY